MARILELLKTYIKNEINFLRFWKFNIKKINSPPTPHSTPPPPLVDARARLPLGLVLRLLLALSFVFQKFLRF